MTRNMENLSPVVAAARGDRDAFHAVVLAHQRLVGSIALAMSGDLASSEDIAQEVFLHAWKGLHRLTRPESFLPWLRELTRNRARDFLRRRGRRHEVLGAEAELLLGQSAAPLEDAEAKLLGAEQAARLAAALDALPEESREVVILYYREGRSAAQVAKLLDLSEAAVRKRLERARGVLREATLDDVGACAEGTAPDEGFARAVMAALPMGAPVGGSLAALQLPLLGKVGAGVLGSGGGLMAGLLGLRYGLRRQLAGAHDEEERRALRRFALWAAVQLVGVCGAMGLATALGHLRVALVLGAVQAIASGILAGIWLPRLQRRRIEAEERADPESAARRRAKRIVGWTACALTAGTLLLAAVLA
ncbi:RNA polymerase sigma factor [Archangium sp.]|uniref:RNA polymerase sigma factor n=1 Tax=Archangium sp. TaxID=1872627 RepID=UPI003899D6B3